MAIGSPPEASEATLVQSPETITCVSRDTMINTAYSYYANSKYLNNTPIVAVNRTGASGAIGAMAVRSAAPDGYTLLVARIATHAILPALDSKLQYKWNEFTMLSLIELNPYGRCTVSIATRRTAAGMTNVISSQQLGERLVDARKRGMMRPPDRLVSTLKSTRGFGGLKAWSHGNHEAAGSGNGRNRIPSRSGVWMNPANASSTTD